MRFLPKRYKPKHLRKKSRKLRKWLLVFLLAVMFALLRAPAPVVEAGAAASDEPFNVSECPPPSSSATPTLIYTPEVEESVEVPVESSWYVTKDEYTDNLGNAMTITNFCAGEWADARTWLEENYTPGWPHGTVKDARPPIDLGETIAVAIAANAMRESICIPATSQGIGKVADERSAAEVTEWLLSQRCSCGRAWGIIQWDGGRRYNFALFCKASGFDPRSLETQLYYMAYEYYASEEYNSYRRLISKYATADASLENVKGAAETFRVKVERGGVAHAADPILENWGDKWSSAWGEKPPFGLYTYLTTS